MSQARGSQYLLIRYTERLAEAGVEPAAQASMDKSRPLL